MLGLIGNWGRGECFKENKNATLSEEPSLISPPPLTCACLPPSLALQSG